MFILIVIPSHPKSLKILYSNSSCKPPVLALKSPHRETNESLQDRSSNNSNSHSSKASILVYLDRSGGMYTTPSNKSFGISKISLLILYHPTNSLSVVISVINVSRLSLFLSNLR